MSFSSFLICLPHLFTGRVYAGVQIAERLHRVHLRACVFQSVKKKWNNTWTPFLLLYVILDIEMYDYLYILDVLFMFIFVVLYCSSVFFTCNYLLCGLHFWRLCIFVSIGFQQWIVMHSCTCVIVFVDFVFSSPEPYIILLDVYFRKVLFIMILYSGSN